MKILKWITISYYVDGDTGEQVTKNKFRQYYTLVRKDIIKEKTKYDTYSKEVVGLRGYEGITTVTNYGRRSNQLKLFEY